MTLVGRVCWFAPVAGSALWIATGCTETCDDAEEFCNDCRIEEVCKDDVEGCRELPDDVGPGYSEDACCEDVMADFADQC